MVENEIDRLIYLFARLPGLGPRSARRAVLHLLKYRESLMLPLADSLKAAADSVKFCSNCGNLDLISPCSICTDIKREKAHICVVESIADLWAMERGNVFRGQYHVLGGALSAVEGRTPEDLNIEKLVYRVANGNIEEVIIATNATVEGQTTAYYITERLKNFNIKVSRIAYGVPVGGELDYLDEGTLEAALKARQPF
jgi:recombination protein RecR